MVGCDAFSGKRFYQHHVTGEIRLELFRTCWEEVRPRDQRMTKRLTTCTLVHTRLLLKPVCTHGIMASTAAYSLCA